MQVPIAGTGATATKEPVEMFPVPERLSTVKPPLCVVSVAGRKFEIKCILDEQRLCLDQMKC
jgi:hypothetical protein